MLLFVSVTLHELGHSLEALRLGVGVRNITLYPMGGIAWLERIPKNPWHELRIVAAGPLVTFLLAGALWLLDQSLQSRTVTPSTPDLLDRLILSGWGQIIGVLASMNLTIGLFNLIPGFPLDGGRIFRALLAMRLDYVRATTIAARVGQGAAVLLGASLLLPGSNASYFGSTFRIVIALFIWAAARGELDQVKQRRSMERRTAGEVMIRAAAVLAPHVSLLSAKEFMRGTNQPVFPVLDDFGRPVGWVTVEMVEAGLAARDAGTRIGQIMLEQVEYVGEQTPLQEAIELMIEKQHPALAVVETDGRLKGILIANLAVAPGSAQEPSLN